MSEFQKWEVLFEYCFNEFLKMGDFLGGEIAHDRRKFLGYVLHVFQNKISESTEQQLIPLDKYPLPEKDTSEMSK